MKYAVLVSREKAPFAPVEEMLKKKDVCLDHARTGKELLELLSKAGSPVALIIISAADTEPKPLIEDVVVQSPFSHCVVAGDMDKEAFHDFYEGYGVLMQIGALPTPEDVVKLSDHLDKLAQLGSF